MPGPPPLEDRLRAVRDIADAQVRLSRALVSELRAHGPWQETLRAEARGGKQKARWLQLLGAGRTRPSHAVLADQLASVQRCVSELSLWADRAQAERRAAAADRERLEAEASAASEALAAATAKAGEDRRALVALHAELDGLPTRLDPRYAPLEARARELHHVTAGAELQCDRLSEVADRSQAAATVARELERALERSEQTLRRLERVATQAADRVHRALGEHGAGAGARELAESLAAAVKDVDPEAVESLAKETERFLSERAGAARPR